MDGSRNMAIDFKNRRYYILYVGVHGGSGMGANYSCSGRYYLVSPDIWEKNKDSYCMVHDSALPRAWTYYDKNGICLLEENDYPGPVTSKVLTEMLSCLETDILDVFAEEDFH